MSEESEMEEAVALPKVGKVKGAARWLVVLLVVAAGMGGYVVLEKT